MEARCILCLAVLGAAWLQAGCGGGSKDGADAAEDAYVEPAPDEAGDPAVEEATTDPDGDEAAADPAGEDAEPDGSCGDAACGADESCATCPEDCGPCPLEQVRGLLIGGNWFTPADIDALRRLIPALPGEGANTMVLILNYLFPFESHPECGETSGVMTKAEAAELAALARESGLRLVPGMNLLGHQSYEAGEANYTFALLRAYPEFDESPDIADTEYARSLCPHAEGVREIILDLADEMIDTFGADEFYVGLDEVFLINHDERCTSTGETSSQIFVEWVNMLQEHLAGRGVRMWMAGDRLLPPTMYDAYWESSDNNTWQSIGDVAHPSDIVIVDWHYGLEEGGYPSIDEIFSPAGFNVTVAPWRNLEGTQAFVQYALDPTGPKFENVAGVVQTLWGGPLAFTSWLLDGSFPDGVDQEHRDEAVDVVTSLRWMMDYLQP